MITKRAKIAAALGAVSALALSMSYEARAFAQTASAVEEKRFDIPSQPLSEAIAEFSRQSSVTVIAPSSMTDGLRSRPVSGTLPPAEALRTMVGDADLELRPRNDGSIVLAQVNDTETSATGVRQARRSTLDETAPFGTEENPARMDTIIVSAQRREEAIQDVPMAVTVLEPAELAVQGFTTFEEVLEFVPGIVSNGGDNPNGNNGRILSRGVSTNVGGAPLVAFYIDDAAASGGTPLSGEFIPDVTLLDIERVEFLKGPQGTLYGANALGGAVKYVTKDPALSEFRARISADISSTDEGGTNQLYNGNVSFPLLQDKIGLTLSGYYEDSGGLIDLVDRTNGDVFFENADAFERYGYSARLLFDVTERLDVDLTYIAENYDFGGGRFVEVGLDTREPVFEDFTRSGDPAVPVFSEIEFEFYSGAINYDFDWATFTSVSSYIESTDTGTDDIVSLAGPFADIVSGNPIGTTTSVPRSSIIAYEKFSQEIRLESPSNETFEWTAGAFYSNEEGSVFGDIVGQPTNIVINLSDELQMYEEISVFGNATYYLTPKLDISAGFRYSEQTVGTEATIAGAVFGLAPGEVQTQDVEVEANSDTYSFAIRYRPIDTLSLYSRVASGFRPAVSNLPKVDPISGVNLAEELVEPDNLWSYEIGAKGDLGGGVLSYDVALWRTDWDNFQTRIAVAGAGNFQGNADGGITAQGVEFASVLRPIDGLSINSSVAYTDSTLNEDEPRLFGLEGQQVPFVPKWTVVVSGQYDFEIVSGFDAHIGGGLRHVSDRRSAFDDGNPNNSVANFTVDGYTLLDLNAGFKSGSYAVNVYATNLTNEVENVSAITASAASGVTSVVPVLPRTIGVVLSANF